MTQSLVAAVPSHSQAGAAETSAAFTEPTEAATVQGFFSDVVRGLGMKPKTLPCKYLYDARGSQLFERICDTPEYYVTRTELSLLAEVSLMVARLIGPNAHVIEPGSGAGQKIRLLLGALHAPRSYTPVDISPSALWASARAFEADYPDLEVNPIVADFTQGLPLPDALDECAGPRLLFFPGSTIGNFAPAEARDLMRQMGQVLRVGDWLLVGVDRIKDVATLEAAYDDAGGVTAEFNLNLLHRIARELPSNLSPRNFRHEARFNERQSRVEMHLVSEVDQRVQIGRARFYFARGESIHTENSYKYTVAGFTALAERAGFDLEGAFSDPRQLYALYLLRWRG